MSIHEIAAGVSPCIEQMQHAVRATEQAGTQMNEAAQQLALLSGQENGPLATIAARADAISASLRALMADTVHVSAEASGYVAMIMGGTSGEQQTVYDTGRPGAGEVLTPPTATKASRAGFTQRGNGSLEIQPIPGNKIVDCTETPLIAYRLSHAVARWNVAHPNQQATLEVYVDKDDAQPPIDSRDAKTGEIYTRMSYPEGQFAAIQAAETDVSYVDSPRRTN